MASIDDTVPGVSGDNTFVHDPRDFVSVPGGAVIRNCTAVGISSDGATTNVIRNCTAVGIPPDATPAIAEVAGSVEISRWSPGGRDAWRAHLRMGEGRHVVVTGPTLAETLARLAEIVARYGR